MCLAVPARITKILDDGMAMADIGGASKPVSLALVENVVVGDYVIVHVGYALSRMDPEEAEKTLKTFEEYWDAGARDLAEKSA